MFNGQAQTRQLGRIADATGGKTFGLQYRLKTESSLYQKLGDTPANQTFDNVRYTLLYEKPEQLGPGAKQAMDELLAAGYERVRVKNTFKQGANYKGINTVFKSKEGQFFEVQFHTEQSNKLNKQTHDIYEAKRQLPKGSDEYNRLHQQSIDIANDITVPEGIQIDVPEVIQAQGTATGVLGYTSYLKALVGREADDLFAKASKAQAMVTATLGDIVKATDGTSIGLEHRLKTVASLSEKLTNTPRAEVFDALRYTITYPDDALGANSLAALKQFEDKGFEVLRVKNTFREGAPYKGINVVLRSPKDPASGAAPQLFEVQFHTPDSYRINKTTHEIYERKRLLVNGSREWTELDAEGRLIADQIKIPPNIQQSVREFSAARGLIQKAREAEPAITTQIELLARATGGEPFGLQYRLKTEPSLIQKLGDTPANQTFDNVRYTLLYQDKDRLGPGAGEVIQRLESSGYRKVRVKNTFKQGENYKGINTVFESPGGQFFEVQFHTEQSNRLNKQTHDIYEEKRQLAKDSDRYKELHEKSINIAGAIEIPDNILNHVPLYGLEGSVKTGIPGYFGPG